MSEHEDEGFDPLMSALEALFLEHRELLDSYGISLGVLRNIKSGPLYEHHKRVVETIEKQAMDKYMGGETL